MGLVEGLPFYVIRCSFSLQGAMDGVGGRIAFRISRHRLNGILQSDAAP